MLPAIAGDETFQQRPDFWLGSDIQSKIVTGHTGGDEADTTVLLCGMLALANKAHALTHPEPGKPHEIIWGINVAPPFHIANGDYQGEGICDVLVDVMQDQLPQLSHHIRRLPARRITLLMKREKNLCFPCLIRRSSYNAEFNYTETTHKYPPHGILAHTKAAKHIIDRYGNPVSFEALAQDTDFRFAQPIERRYGTCSHYWINTLFASPINGLLPR